MLDPSAVTEFLALFDSVKRTHAKAGMSATQSAPVHLEALRFVREHDWPWAEKLVEAAFFTYTQPTKAIATLEGLEVPEPFTGHLPYGKANAYLELGELERSIPLYQAACETPGFDSVGASYNNMGYAHASLGAYEEAIECFELALASEGFAWPGYARYNIAHNYERLGDSRKAIRWYEAALDTPGFDSPGDARNNIGVAYSNLEEHAESAKWFKAAVETPDYSTPGEARLNLANAYRMNSQFEEAKAVLAEVLAGSDADEKRRARQLLKLTQQERIDP